MSGYWYRPDTGQHTVYQLSPVIFRKQIKQFECITRAGDTATHLRRDGTLLNGKAFVKGILEKSKEIYEHVGFLE